MSPSLAALRPAPITLDQGDTPAMIAARRAALYDATDHMPSVGALRRFSALLALGHSERTISDAAGMTLWVGRLTRHPHLMPAEVHAAVMRAWRALSARPGTSTRTRTRALAAGLVPPCAWEDDAALDDPAASPLAEVLWTGRPAAGALVEDVDWLARTGETPERAAARLGRTVGALERALLRAGRPDLVTALKRNEGGMR